MSHVSNIVIAKTQLQHAYYIIQVGKVHALNAPQKTEGRKKKLHENIPILWFGKYDYTNFFQTISLKNNIFTFRKFCTLYTTPTLQGRMK